MIAALARAAGALWLACATGHAALAADIACPARVVYLVRHAEKAPEQGDPDVPLSDAGRRNAEVLATAFAGKPPDAVYATHLRRTQQTVAPLAEAADLDVRVLPASATGRLLARLRTRHCGAVVLVAGHSNTLPDIMAGLGVDAAPAIPDDEYGVVYAVTPAADGATVARGTFADPP